MTTCRIPHFLNRGKYSLYDLKHKLSFTTRWKISHVDTHSAHEGDYSGVIKYPCLSKFLHLTHAEWLILAEVRCLRGI